MKKYSISLCLCAIGLFLAFACKKSNSGNNSSIAASSYLSSVVFYGPSYRTVDSFCYDNTHLLDTFTQTSYDSLTTPYFYDSLSVRFIYQGQNIFPSSYYYYLYESTGWNYADYHQLSYDGQGRISEDSSLSDTGTVSYYSYPNNNITIIELPEGNVQGNNRDTFYITNGNVSSYSSYAFVPPLPYDLQQAYLQYTYTSVANPAYHAAVAGTFGPLLNHLTSYTDFLSKNAYDHLNSTQFSSPIYIFSIAYTQTFDNKGRLSKLTGPPGAGSYLFSYY